MASDKAQIPSLDVLVEWARFLGVDPGLIRPVHMEPQIKRLIDEINRLENIDLTNVEPSTTLSVMREMKNEEH